LERKGEPPAGFAKSTSSVLRLRPIDSVRRGGVDHCQAAQRPGRRSTVGLPQRVRPVRNPRPRDLREGSADGSRGSREHSLTMVYVDDMQANYGRMKMCHMLADSTAELLAMADRIGLARRWIQKPGTPYEHFDVCLSKRAAAIRAGAVEITMRDAALLIRRKKAKG